MQVRFVPKIADEDIRKEAVKMITRNMEARAKAEYEEQLLREKENQEAAQVFYISVMFTSTRNLNTLVIKLSSLQSGSVVLSNICKIYEGVGQYISSGHQTAHVVCMYFKHNFMVWTQ